MCVKIFCKRLTESQRKLLRSYKIFVSFKNIYLVKKMHFYITRIVTYVRHTWWSNTQEMKMKSPHLFKHPFYKAVFTSKSTIFSYFSFYTYIEMNLTEFMVLILLIFFVWTIFMGAIWCHVSNLFWALFDLKYAIFQSAFINKRSFLVNN